MKIQRTFHFDLRHVADCKGLSVSIGGATYPLRAHDEASLREARRAHPVLSALPEGALQRFTHYADVDLAHHAGVGFLFVVRPPAPRVHLGEVVLASVVLPEGHLRAYYRDRLKGLRGRAAAASRSAGEKRPRLHSGKLAALGLASLPADEESALNLLVQSQTVATPTEAAQALAFCHPNLANVQPYTAAVVLNDHILPDADVDADQYNAVMSLANAIGDKKHQPWSPVIPCTDKNGTPFTAGYAVDDFSPGDPLSTFGLSDPVMKAVTPVTCGAQRSAMDDTSLQGLLWSPSTGTASLTQASGAPAPRPKAAAAAPAYKWTVSEKTKHHGVTVDSSSIIVDASEKFSIDATNSYLRTLYVGYQRYDDGGARIGDKALLCAMGPVDVFMGIPLPAEPTGLSFGLNDASSVELLFGGIGTTDWDAQVSTPGALLTGLWQYGIPLVFVVVGKSLDETTVFNDIVLKLSETALDIATDRLVCGSSGDALANAGAMLVGMAEASLSIAMQKGMEELGLWLVEQVGKGELTKGFGPVGWALRIAAAGMDFALMAETTGEVLSSPATIRVKVSRAIDVAVTLHPDPKHGEAGNPSTAVWPSVAVRYEATLQCQGGTTLQLAGPLPSTTSNDPLPLLFADVPAGSQFRIIAGLYSENGWLAGSWQSDWIAAKSKDGTTTLQLGDQTITENLVPLAQDTQYVYKEKVVGAGGDFAWRSGDPPPAVTHASLNESAPAGLSELVGISVNNSAFQVGYAWRASGQSLYPDTTAVARSNAQLYAVQSLSVLAHPGARLKTSQIGFTSRPAVAYAPSINATDQIDQTNFILDPRQGGMHLRKVVLETRDGKTDFGLGDANLQSWGRFPLENVDALVVHPSNVVIGASWKDHKLMVLELPEAPSADAAAPLALPVSGYGARQGLLNGPRSLAVHPDGRILVLESLNRRIQAFDLKGNPVPGFTPKPMLGTLVTADVSGALDAGQMPEQLQALLQAKGYTYRFPLDRSFVPELDGGVFEPAGDPLIAALSEQGVILSLDPEHMSDPKMSAQIQVVQKGQSWIIADPRNMAWQVLLPAGSNALKVYQLITQAEVRVEKQGERWLLVDHGSSSAFRLSTSPADPAQAEVKEALSWFPMRDAGGTITYLDMAVEAQGYVFVLGYLGDGSKPTNYLLDVYAPDGTFLFTTPDSTKTNTPQNVVADKIAVDIWRNLYALTYEPMPGVATPQPGLAHWNPTPPLFGLDLSYQKDFNDNNITVIAKAFAEHKIILSSQAFIEIEDRDGAWAVKDGVTIYHVYRSGDALQVYAVPA